MISYLIGFTLSLLLTLLAFWKAPYLGLYAPLAIVALALLQLSVQLACFLHIGRKESRLQAWLFAFSFLITAILAGGTLWIMHNLSRLHRDDTQMDLYQGGVVAPQNELH